MMPTSYTYSTSGGFVQPSNVSYKEYILTKSIELVWPSSFTNNPNVTAALMNLKAEDANLHMTLPSAREVSVGQNIMMFNIGNHTIEIRKRGGEKLLELKTEQCTYIYLTDNKTEAGVWSQIPFGVGKAVVSSVGATSDDDKVLAIEGSPVTTQGTLVFKVADILKRFVKIEGNGLATLKAGTWLTRTLQGGNQMTVTNPDGQNGNPTVALNDPLAVNQLSVGMATIKSLTVEQPIGGAGGTIPDQSVPLTKLKGSDKVGALIDTGNGTIVNTPSEAAGTEICVLSGGGQDAKATKYGTYFRQLWSVWNASKPNSFQGEQLTDKTISLAKLSSSKQQGVLSDAGDGSVAITPTYDKSEYIRLLAGGPASVNQKTWPLAFWELADFWNYSRPNSCAGKILADKTISQSKIDAAFAQSLVPTGCIMPFAGANAPAGWFICNGRTASRETDAALFAVIGTTYGVGDGANTFNVPNLRGRAMFGFVDGATDGLITGATADKLALGGKGGKETHVLTVNEMPSHSHALEGYYGEGTAVIGNDFRGYATQNFNKKTQNTGGGQAHTNMPPFILMNFIIKA